MKIIKLLLACLADVSASVPRALTNSNIIAMFVVGMLFVWRHQWLTKGISPEEIGRSRYRGCPSWMRFSSYALMSIGVALFAFSLLLEYFGIAPAGNGTTMPPTISGGFGLMAYSAFFSQLYSAKALYQRG